MQQWVLEKFYYIATHHFHRWYGLLASLSGLAILALIIFPLIPKGEITFINYIKAWGIPELILMVGWCIYVWKYPKRSKKRLGVVVAIKTENFEDHQLLENDFLNPFRSRMGDLGLPFDILVLRNHQSEKVLTKEDALKALKRTKGHFCIWGSVKKRRGGKEGNRYFFYLRGVVIHKPIEEVKKVVLREEFNALLPSNLMIEESLQFELFDVRVNQAIAAVDYITGRAALLSGDFATAIQLHEAIFNAIQRGEKYPIGKDRLKTLLGIEYDTQAYIYSLDRAKKSQFEESVKKALFFNHRNYGALLKKAILEFDYGQGDARLALRTIGDAKHHAHREYQWLYSKIFLHLWLEDYPEALQGCEKLKEKSYEGENLTIVEVIKFTEEILQSHPKPQLYFWLGFVAFVKDKNSPLADEYFQKFLDSGLDNDSLRLRARSYLATIRQQIRY